MFKKWSKMEILDHFSAIVNILPFNSHMDSGVLLNISRTATARVSVGVMGKWE